MSGECQHTASASGPFGDAKFAMSWVLPPQWTLCIIASATWGHGIACGAQSYRQSVLIEHVYIGGGKYVTIWCGTLEEFNKAGKDRKAMPPISDTVIAFQEN